jgi:peptidyl-prolyl cis-trans isomerase SurA
MKKYLLPLFATVLACGTAFSADNTNGSNVVIVEEIVARVNNSIITHMDVEKAREQMAAELKQRAASAGTTVGNTDAELAAHEKDILSDLIDSQLLLQKGDELGIDVQTELIKRLDEIRKSMNLQSMEDLEKAAQAQGISYEEFKDNLKNDLIKRNVISKEVVSKIQITPKEAQDFYQAHKAEMEHPEQVHLAEILIAPKTPAAEPGKEAPEPTPEAQQEARKKAEDLLAQLKAGAKFDEIAKKNSEGPTAAQGGDLGMFRPGTMAKELETITFALKSGELSNVIETKQGYVILKVLDHQQAGIPPYKDVENQVMDQLYMQRTDPALRTYLTKLREQAYIEIKPSSNLTDSHASPNENQPVYVAGNEQSKQQDKTTKKKKKLLLF